METEKSSAVDSPLDRLLEGTQLDEPETSLVGNNDGEAQIDPRYFAPVAKRRGSDTQRTRTSLVFALFEYCLENGLLSLRFDDQLSTIWRLEKFVNASFHSGYLQSLASWRQKILENEVLRNRLLKQHKNELERLTYPMPKRAGSKPKRKRGYSDKGSTRPLHQRFRTDKDTSVSVWAEDLQVVEKVVVYGRRPTVTYRRLPYSREIGRLLELGLLRKEGSFITPSQPTGD